MIIPIRCFSCNKPISAKYLIYLEKKKEIENEDMLIDTNNINKNALGKSKYGEILDKLEINRYCCRRMFLGQVDIIDVI